jgi:hypothetical protein
MANRSGAVVKRSAKSGANTRKRNFGGKSRRSSTRGGSFAEEFRRIRERALRLNELLVQCRQSGTDPEEHPEVVNIRHELATHYDKFIDILANEAD